MVMVPSCAVFCPAAKLAVTKHSLYTQPQNLDAVDRVKLSVKSGKMVLNSKEGNARDQWRSKVKLSVALNRWEMLNKQ